MKSLFFQVVFFIAVFTEEKKTINGFKIKSKRLFNWTQAFSLQGNHSLCIEV